MYQAYLLKREFSLVLKDDRADLSIWEGASPKQDLEGQAQGLHVVCKFKKKRIFIAVISLEAILFDSLILKETFPFTTKGNFTNENVVILATF